MQKNLLKPVLYGLLSTTLLLGFYFAILTFVSGWDFTKDQFFTFWYFVTTLALGFGIQIGLFTYLKNAIHAQGQSGKVVAVTGTTSTIAMISCCAHYLVNLVPLIGVAGIVSFVAQYQIQLFWIGLISNLIGIFYISNRILKFKRSQNEKI